MKVKFAIFAACICLGMPCLAQDREVSAAAAAYEQAHEQWMIGLARYLTERENPIVRVVGSWQMDTLSRRHPDLEGEGRKARTSALADGWWNPAVILNVHAADCTHGRAAQGCDSSAVQSQMLEIDPDNAVTVLLPWLFPSERSEEALELNARNVAMLTEAAGKDTFDLYMTAGVFDAYKEIKKYESLQSLPEIPQELMSEINEKGIHLPDNPAWNPSYHMLMSVFARTGSAAYSKLTDFCGLAESENHAGAMYACLELADLMQTHSKTVIAEMMGHAVKKKIERPGYTGANKELKDPERWRDQVRRLAYRCAYPRMISNFTMGQMPPDHWPHFIRDLQESGERVANQRAAEREYAEFPELYEMNPADCSLIHELDEKTQQRLASEYENNQLGTMPQARNNGAENE